MRECIDVVDPGDGRHLGKGDRAEVHRSGRWHQVFHCLVVRPSKRTVVLQERARTKATFPGLLDLSATGHLLSGESVIDGVREITEELGVEVDPSQLVPLGVRLLADNGGEGRNRERVHAHLLPDDRPPVLYRPDREEVGALVEIGVADLLACLEGREVPARRWAVVSERSCPDPDLRPGPAPTLDGANDHGDPISVTAGNLVPAVDGYWVVLAVMADRFLDGRGPLAI